MGKPNQTRPHVVTGALFSDTDCSKARHNLKGKTHAKHHLRHPLGANKTSKGYVQIPAPTSGINTVYIYIYIYAINSMHIYIHIDQYILMFMLMSYITSKRPLLPQPRNNQISAGPLAGAAHRLPCCVDSCRQRPTSPKRSPQPSEEGGGGVRKSIFPFGPFV